MCRARIFLHPNSVNKGFISQKLQKDTQILAVNVVWRTFKWTFGLEAFTVSYIWCIWKTHTRKEGCCYISNSVSHILKCHKLTFSLWTSKCWGKENGQCSCQCETEGEHNIREKSSQVVSLFSFPSPFFSCFGFFYQNRSISDCGAATMKNNYVYMRLHMHIYTPSNVYIIRHMVV